jgi:hypothetical protein
MKNLILIAVLAASFAAHAQDKKAYLATFKNEPPTHSFEPMDGTVHVFDGDDPEIKGSPTMLWTITVLKTKKSERTRFAVTGCGSRNGKVIELLPSGYALTTQAHEWVDNGHLVYDRIAYVICTAGAAEKSK